MEPKMVESEPDLTPPAKPASQDEVFAQRGSRQEMDSRDDNDAMPDEVPFYATLSVAPNITMQQGYVFPKKPVSVADALLPITVNMAAANDVAVVVGDKFWCRVEEDETGVVTSATVGKGVAWPVDSVGPELIGGDKAITEGVDGSNVYRLCEVIANGDLTEVKHWLTGNITHKTPELVNNVTNAAYGAGAGGRVLKVFDDTTGTWHLRELVAGTGVTVTEGADAITFAISPYELTVKEEAVALVTGATTLKFVGEGVTATGAAAEKTITIPGVPLGTTGQVLRNVGGVWTAIDVTEVILSYCDGGVPTSGTFLKL